MLLTTVLKWRLLQISSFEILATVNLSRTFSTKSLFSGEHKTPFNFYSMPVPGPPHPLTDTTTILALAP